MVTSGSPPRAGGIGQTHLVGIVGGVHAGVKHVIFRAAVEDGLAEKGRGESMRPGEDAAFIASGHDVDIAGIIEQHGGAEVGLRGASIGAPVVAMCIAAEDLVVIAEAVVDADGLGVIGTVIDTWAENVIGDQRGVRVGGLGRDVEIILGHGALA